MNRSPEPITDPASLVAAAPPALRGFDHHPRTRLVFGPGVLNRLPELVADWGAKRVLLVSDPHITAAGHAPRAQKLLENAGIYVTSFSDVRENPTTEDVDAAVAAARPAAVDTIIAIGGGSSMDTAKGANFLLTSGGTMRDYWGTGKAPNPMLPLVAIPTTAGTGSECQSYALIADPQTHVKMACGDPKAAPRVALLDPELTLTQPPHVTANTAIDTLTHAAEAAVTTRRSELSLLYARESLRLTVASFPAVMQNPRDLGARGRMLLAAAYAGTAIENSMLGAAHAAANPLTARFGVVHGRAVGLMLPGVIRFNAQDPIAASLYAELAIHARLTGPDAPPADAVRDLLSAIHRMLDIAGVPSSLRDAGVQERALLEMADEASRQWTAQFNPRPVTAADFLTLYREAYHPGSHV